MNAKDATPAKGKTAAKGKAAAKPAAKKAAPKVVKAAPKTLVVTQEHLDLNPTWAENNITAGMKIEIPEDAILPEEKAEEETPPAAEAAAPADEAAPPAAPVHPNEPAPAPAEEAAPEAPAAPAAEATEPAPPAEEAAPSDDAANPADPAAEETPPADDAGDEGKPEKNESFGKIEKLCEDNGHKLDYLKEKGEKWIAQVIAQDEEGECKQFSEDSEKDLVKAIEKYLQ